VILKCHIIEGQGIKLQELPKYDCIQGPGVGRRLKLNSDLPCRNAYNFAVLDHHDVMAGFLVRQEGCMYALPGRSDNPRVLGNVR
jgi:hypothetical protein